MPPAHWSGDGARVRKLGLAGLIAVVLATVWATAFAQDGASEVRISARRLADGRVEFAIQPRAGGGWGERVLPSARYFPGNAAVGRWLNSSPVTVGDAEVRISARQLADGRIEFAIQPRAGGGWGERALPPARYFPASAAVGRWLNSSPVAVGDAAAMTATIPDCPGRGGVTQYRFTDGTCREWLASGVGDSVAYTHVSRPGSLTCHASVYGNADRYGRREFMAWLVNDEGYDLLANVTASEYRGEKAVHFARAGWYRVEVLAAGHWVIACY